MNFKLELELGNAAMMNPDDIARALREVARKLDGIIVDADELDPFDRSGRIRDDNGNLVGGWAIR